MTRSAIVLGLLGTLTAVVLASACDESTSGAAIAGPEPDAGAEAAVPDAAMPGPGPGPTDAGADVADAEAGAAALPPCVECAVAKCALQIEACGTACLNALACMAACKTPSCQDRCLRRADTKESRLMSACLTVRCLDQCPANESVLNAGGAYVDVDCALLQACAPRALEQAYGDLGECQTRQGGNAGFRLGLPGTGVSATTFSTCALALSALPCEDYLSARRSLACQIQGSRTLGEPCLDDVQCESSFCPSTGHACSTCALPPALGQPCTAGGRCAPGLLCDANVCKVPARVGQRCDADAPCEHPAFCRAGICRAAATTEGAPCGSATANARCDTRIGLVCSSTTSGACLPFAVSKAGGPCGVVGDAGVFTICQASAACVGGVCARPPAAGEACDDATGPGCTPPDKCVANKCVRPPTGFPCE